jgi:hypothetical protein
VLHVSFACKVFLDYPQKKVWVSWRGSQPCPVRVSKNKILKRKIRVNQNEIRLIFFLFEDDRT